MFPRRFRLERFIFRFSTPNMVLRSKRTPLVKNVTISMVLLLIWYKRHQCMPEIDVSWNFSYLGKVTFRIQNLKYNISFRKDAVFRQREDLEVFPLFWH